MDNMWYPRADVHIGTAFTGWANETVMAMLIATETTTPDDPDHEFVDDISADEGVATGYARVQLTNVAITYDATNDRAEITCDPIDFGTVDAAGEPEAYVGLVIYVEVNDDTDSYLVCAVSLPSLAPNNVNLTLTPGADGFVHFGIGTLS